MLLLGQLDKTEYDLGTTRPPVPLADVTPVLVAEFNKANLPEALRIAALIGLARQSELQLPSDRRTAVAGVATKLIAAKKPLEGFSVDGHHWARRLALQMVLGLSKAGSEMNRPETVKSLNDIIVDGEEPLFLRRDAALALGHLDPSVFGTGTVKPADALKSLGALTIEVSHAGQPRPDPSAPLSLNKGEDVFLAPTEENKKLFAEGVGYYLNCIATALGGRTTKGLKAAPGADQAVVDDFIKRINAMIAPLQRTNASSTQMPQELNSKGSELSSWLATKGLVAPAAAQVPIAGASGNAPGK
jgi:hypothetical protein